MHTFISGGCKNGKSYLAQRLAKSAGEPLYYIATMISTGREDDVRIARHIREREGWGFQTLECGRDICSCLNAASRDGSFLLDSVTALLANEMFAPSGFDPHAAERVAQELCRFVGSVRHAVIVSDYIYSDAQRFDDWTQTYRKGLAHIDAYLTDICENVLEVCSGTIICHKGVNML